MSVPHHQASRRTIKLRVLPSADAVGRVIADEVQCLLQQKDAPVLGLATGSSPLTTYQELRRRFAAGDLSFAGVRGFLLDEYIGLPRGHVATYAAVIDSELGDRVGLRAGAIMGPDVWRADLEKACHQYEEAIADAGGIDLQLLGIGSNGHIGFNEPGSDFSSRTRIARLASRTRVDNSRFFGGDVEAVPTHCLTQGLGTIREARRIVLIATGASKSKAVARLMTGSPSPDFPASALQGHPAVSLVIDAAAAFLLPGFGQCA